MAREDSPKTASRCRTTKIFLGLSAWPGLGPTSSWFIFISGLVLYLAVQGALTIAPLHGWSLFPKADDTLTYVLKTRQMEECFMQHCPALEDLRPQLHGASVSPEATRQCLLAASKIFPVYHPLFSLILLAITKLGLNLMAAYRLIWYLGPLIFGAAFACLLTALFGRPAAGLALALLAFKVFPDTGLHHVEPSNLAMAVAVLIWARIVARRGDAPWTWAIGSLVLVGMHIIGVIYCAMTVVLALSLASAKARARIWPGVAVGGLVIFLAFLIPTVVKGLPFVIPTLLPPGIDSVSKILTGAAQSLAQVVVDITRLMDGLLGSLPLFCGAVVLGLASLTKERRTRVLKFLAVYGFSIFALFFYVSSHPADVIFRVWIPLVVVLFGLVGQALWYASCLTWNWARERLKTGELDRSDTAAAFWPPVVLALLLGYSLHMMILGGEQVYATVEHLRQREPLDLNPAQPELLLAHAHPGDRVLYTSFTLMPYYLIHGALQLGAVYYHPALRDEEKANRWLAWPELRFAVTYNPLLTHPSYEGVDEHRWWITSPDFHFSPLNRPRRYMPLAREGKIAAADFHWLEVETAEPQLPGLFRVLIHNPGKQSELTVCAGEAHDCSRVRHGLKVPVPPGWSGWLEINPKVSQGVRKLRLLFPGGYAPYFLGGLSFARDHLLWPWSQKARLSLLPKAEYGGPITVSFNPADLLPAPLNQRKVEIMDDRGSSVLMHILAQ